MCPPCVMSFWMFKFISLLTPLVTNVMIAVTPVFLLDLSLSSPSVSLRPGVCRDRARTLCAETVWGVPRDRRESVRSPRRPPLPDLTPVLARAVISVQQTPKKAHSHMATCVTVTRK